MQSKSKDKEPTVKEPVMESAEASQLLESVDHVSRSARAARHAYWFPLVLFGLIILGTLFFLAPPGRGPASCGSGQILVPLPLSNNICQSAGRPSPAGEFVSSFGGGGAPHPWGLGLYWLIAVPVGFFATVAFYGIRARRKGVVGRVWPFVVAGIVLFGLLLVTAPGISLVLHAPHWLTDWHGRAYVSYLFHRGLAPTIVFALGFFVLARLERSWVLGGIAAAFFGVALLANLYNISNAFQRLHWIVPDWAANSAVAGGFLVFCGAVTWLAGRRATA